MKIRVTVFAFLVLSGFVNCEAASVSLDLSIFEPVNVTFDIQQQYDSVRPESKSAIEVKFNVKDDWHFYASGTAALQVVPSVQEDFITFGKPIFPVPQEYLVKELNETFDVFGGTFSVYLPFEVGEVELEEGQSVNVGVQINVEGPMCWGTKCSNPSFEPPETSITIAADATMETAAFEVPQVEAGGRGALRGPNYSVWFAFLLAFLAGLILNIMPCVLPVIPLKVLSIFEQAKHSKTRCIMMGLSFCAGILLFFAVIAVINIILRVGYGQAFQWGEHFRKPEFLIGMSALLVGLAMFLFGVVTFIVPSSVAGKGESRKGLVGSVGMGFLAAVLGTPCSFAILTAAFAWAQTQRLFLSTAAIMLIGVGMAAPYMVLTSMPSLLKYLPKPGRWMELFKQSMGFLLLAVALWLINALPEDRAEGTLYFCAILGFCIWMWGGWVTYNTGRVKKYVVRLIAVAIVLPAGFVFLPKPAPPLVDWLEYDRAKINEAVQRQKPVLIDFTADWCPNCRIVDIFVYESKSVAKLIEQKGVLAFKGDASSDDAPAPKDLEEIYMEPALPVTLLFVPGQAEPERLPGIAIGKQLKELLKQLPDAETVEDPNE